MKRRAAGWVAGLTLALGCLLGGGRAVYAQTAVPAPLDQAVQLAPGNRSLGAILRELSRQSRLPLSYSSSLVPLTRRYAVRPGPVRPLGEVLRDVLGAAHLKYGLLDGQLVLWPARAAAPPGVLAAIPDQAGHQPAAVDPAALPIAPPGTSEHAPVATGRASGHGKQLAPRWAAGLARVPTKPAATSPAPGRGTTGNARETAAVPEYGPLISHRAAGRREATTAARGASLAAAPNNAKQAKLAGSPAAGAVAHQDPKTNPLATRQSKSQTVAPLVGRPVGLVVARQLLPAGLPASARARPAATPVPADAPRPTLGRLAGLYLHGEAWLSESLPVGGTAKVGLTRAYLVVGVAAGPFDHPAWGVGLGTAGRARGRFTPSLDLVEWFVPGDEHESVNLTQLRTQLAWQLKRQGRLALLAGPTLNLAAVDNHGSARGSFGQHQWLWLDDGDGHHSVRFWPGIQLGLRF